MNRRDGIKAKRITTITELLKFFRKNIPPKEVCWFRGHGKENWQLLPQLARKKKWLRAESDLIAKFKQSSSLLLRQMPKSEWEWLTVMQHHGVPTRLLDWTESPLVALYFAVYEDPKYDGALWALFPTRLNKISNIAPDYEKYIPTFEDAPLNPYTPKAVRSEDQVE